MIAAPHLLPLLCYGFENKVPHEIKAILEKTASKLPNALGPLRSEFEKLFHEVVRNHLLTFTSLFSFLMCTTPLRADSFICWGCGGANVYSVSSNFYNCLELTPTEGGF